MICGTRLADCASRTRSSRRKRRRRCTTRQHGQRRCRRHRSPRRQRGAARGRRQLRRVAEPASPTVLRGRGRQDGNVDVVVQRDVTEDADAGVTARRVANQVLHAAGANSDEERNPSRLLCVADAVARREYRRRRIPRRDGRRRRRSHRPPRRQRAPTDRATALDPPVIQIVPIIEKQSLSRHQVPGSKNPTRMYLLTLSSFGWRLAPSRLWLMCLRQPPTRVASSTSARVSVYKKLTPIASYTRPRACASA